MSDKEIVETNEKELQPQSIDKEKIKEWLQATGKIKELTKDEASQFIEISQGFGLNPFKREIYVAVFNKNDPSKRQLSIVIGYEVYLKRAERIRALDGWKCWTEGSGQDMKAIIQIYRKDRQYPFQWEVPYKEAVQLKMGGGPNYFWSKMPSLMLKKVCISQGFRLCFPDDLGGIPYTDAEMPPHEYADFETIPNDNQQTEQPSEQSVVEPPEMEGRVPEIMPVCPKCGTNANVMPSKFRKPGATYYCNKPCGTPFEPVKEPEMITQPDIF
jgi:phage recombination protein Bet